MKVKKSLWVVLACVLALSFAAVACDAKSADNYTVESVTLSEDEITIKVGEKVTLTYTVEPEDCADEVKWRSSDTDHVTVSSGGENPGEVTGVAVTDEPVTITLQVGDMKDTCKVTVVEGETVAVTGVTLNKSELTLTEGGSEKLTATVTPADATDKTVTWESDKTSVATVGKDGTVTAVAAGTATITATAGGKSATCEVTVNAKEVAATGVTINKDTLTLTEGGASDTLTATVTPANSTDTVAWSVTEGKEYIEITPNGNTVTVKPVAAGTATITATAGDFSDTCTVTVNAAEAPKQLVRYSVQDNAFTDGTNTVSGGTIENGGFKANSVNTLYAQNPYYQDDFTDASIVIEFYIANATQAAWAPIVGIKDSGSGFLSVHINNQNQVRLSYNAYDGADNYFDIVLGDVAVGKHTVLIETRADGSVDIYYDSATPVEQLAAGDEKYATGTERQTVGEFLAQAERMYLFGGAWGVLSVEGDTWTWTENPWNGAFDGSIISCTLYEGIVPAGDVFTAE